MKRVFSVLGLCLLARCGGSTDEAGHGPKHDAASEAEIEASSGGTDAGSDHVSEPDVSLDASDANDANDATSDAFDATIDVAPDPCGSNSFIDIDAPQEITAPGCYRVTQDLSNGDAALYIHDTAGVYLDCDGHTLFSTGSTLGALRIENLSDFSVRNCTLRAELPEFVTYGLEVDGSQNGVFDHDLIRAGNVKQSSKLWVVNGAIESYYQQNESNDVVVANNAITGDPSVTIAATIVFAFGSNNQALYNQIDGKWNGDLSSQLAADDGIVVQEETGDTIVGNVITNTWDCGFETVGVVKDTEVSGNQMSHSGFCCIGAWHWNSWLGNVVSENSCSDIGSMFVLKRFHAFEPTETVLWFKNNTFHHNVQIPGGWENPSVIDFANLPPEIPASAVDLGNDVFSDNTFTFATPIFVPASMFVDAGGNTCPQGTDPAFPLACGKP